MKIEMTTPIAAIDAFLLKQAKIAQYETVKMFARLGEECVNEARDRPSEDSWNDVTGNLRSSVGYVVSVDGEPQLMSAFKQVLNGTEGVRKGQKHATELAKHINKGYGLTVVAGMEYAAIVEARDDKCVLASAELLGRKKLPDYIAKLEHKLNRK